MCNYSVFVKLISATMQQAVGVVSLPLWKSPKKLLNLFPQIEKALAVSKSLNKPQVFSITNGLNLPSFAGSHVNYEMILYQTEAFWRLKLKVELYIDTVKCAHELMMTVSLNSPLLISQIKCFAAYPSRHFHCRQTKHMKCDACKQTVAELIVHMTTRPHCP